MFISRRFGLFGSIMAVVAVAMVLALIPQATAVNTSAENCVNPPTTPTLNHWPVTYNTTNTPLCHDFRAIDAAVHVPGGTPVFSQNEADWQNGLQLSAGQEGVALIYVHNGAANNLPSSQTMARNVKVVTSTETAVGTIHKIVVQMYGDNTNTVTQHFNIHTPAGSKLEVVPNSGAVYDYQGRMIPGKTGLNLGNSTYNLGDLAACFEYSVFLTYRFKVITQQEPQVATLGITKQVRAFDSSRSANQISGFTSSTTVNQNEQVEYRISVTNTSNIVAKNVTMTDLGTSGIQVAMNSTSVGVADDALLGNHLWQGAIPGTLNLGDLQPGETRIIKYRGTAIAASGTFTNTATAIASNTASVSASAVVTIRTIVTPGHGKLGITKQVRNISKNVSYANEVSANNGDRVMFRITVTNSGNTSLNNVRVNDPMPNGLVFDDSVDTIGTPSFNNGTLSVNFGTLPAGTTRTLEFAVIVSTNSSLRSCNIATALADGVSSAQAQACVNVSVTPKPGTPNIVLSKKAYNDTKMVDATLQMADRGNTITYTLTTTNNGNADAVNYIIRDDLSGVLPLADIADTRGGIVSGNMITYPAVTIKPGETVTKTFVVKVKTTLAPTLSFQMKNTYGNTVVITIPGNIVYEAPKTGSATTSAAVFAGLLTAGALAIRRGKDIYNFIFA